LPKPPGRTLKKQLNPLEFKIFAPPGKVHPPPCMDKKWNSPLLTVLSIKNIPTYAFFL